jgi:hypothetical protein
MPTLSVVTGVGDESNGRADAKFLDEMQITRIDKMDQAEASMFRPTGLLFEADLRCAMGYCSS